MRNLIFLMLLLPVMGWGQEVHDDVVKKQFMIPGTTVEAIAQSVVLLISAYPLEDSVGAEAGTIVIDSKNVCYIVTATHVVKAIKDNPFMIVQDVYGNPIPIRISDIAVGVWRHHPIADLSVLEVDVSKIPADKRLSIPAIPIESISKRKDGLSRNIWLAVLGYPAASALKGNLPERFLPLTYRSMALSVPFMYTRLDVRTQQAFIALDNPGTTGYGGGPVYDLKDDAIESIDAPEDDASEGRGGMIEVVGFIHWTHMDIARDNFTLMTPSFYFWDLVK